MNKIFIGLVLVAALALGWFIINSDSTVDYVATVDTEVSALESELVAIDAAVQNGTLTSEEATQAKIAIMSRLNTINSSVSASNNGKLTPSQQTQLNEGLNRLKAILIAYRDTLGIVDTQADDEKVRSSLETDSENQTITETVLETIDSVEDVAEDVIEDYEPTLEEEIEEIQDETEEMTSDDSPETTEGNGDETAPMTETSEETDTSTTDDSVDTSTDTTGTPEEVVPVE